MKSMRKILTWNSCQILPFRSLKVDDKSKGRGGGFPRRSICFCKGGGRGGRTMWKNVRGWGGRWSLALWRCFHHERYKVGLCSLTGKNYGGICTPNEMALFKLEISLHSRYEWWLLSWFFQRPSVMACSSVPDILGVRERVKRTQSFAPSRYLRAGNRISWPTLHELCKAVSSHTQFFWRPVSHITFLSSLFQIYAYDSCILSNSLFEIATKMLKLTNFASLCCQCNIYFILYLFPNFLT